VIPGYIGAIHRAVLFQQVEAVAGGARRGCQTAQHTDVRHEQCRRQVVSRNPEEFEQRNLKMTWSVKAKKSTKTFRLPYLSGVKPERERGSGRALIRTPVIHN